MSEYWVVLKCWVHGLRDHRRLTHILILVINYHFKFKIILFYSCIIQLTSYLHHFGFSLCSFFWCLGLLFASLTFWNIATLSRHLFQSQKLTWSFLHEKFAKNWILKAFTSIKLSIILCVKELADFINPIKKSCDAIRFTWR